MIKKMSGNFVGTCSILFGCLILASSFAQSDAGRTIPPLPTDAASNASESSADAGLSAFDHYIVRGGWVTIYILIPLSITAVALMLQNAVTIRRMTIIPQDASREIRDLFERKQYEEAARVVAANRSAAGKIILAGLQAAKEGLSAMERAMEEAVDEQASRFHHRIEHLNLIGNLAPMLGLLGTVHGIIGMFVSIADTGGVPVMARISHDLGSALVATFWGLAIAIPTLAMFGWMRLRVDVLMRECAELAESVLLSLGQQVADSGKTAETKPEARVRVPAAAASG